MLSKFVQSQKPSKFYFYAQGTTLGESTERCLFLSFLTRICGAKNVQNAVKVVALRRNLSARRRHRFVPPLAPLFSSSLIA
jgi:hypothetical protein